MTRTSLLRLARKAPKGAVEPARVFINVDGMLRKPQPAVPSRYVE